MSDYIMHKLLGKGKHELVFSNQSVLNNMLIKTRNLFEILHNITVSVKYFIRIKTTKYHVQILDLSKTLLVAFSVVV